MFYFTGELEVKVNKDEPEINMKDVEIILPPEIKQNSNAQGKYILSY